MTMSGTNTRSPNTTPTRTRYGGSTSAGRQWWKLWVLLTSIAATVLGWMAFPADQPSASPESVSTQVPAPVNEAIVLPAETVDRTRPLAGVVHPLPAMPQKPVFQAPITRTRRS